MTTIILILMVLIVAVWAIAATLLHLRDDGYGHVPIGHDHREVDYR